MKAVEIYKTKDGQIQIEVKFEEETVWLNQADIVMLFGSSKANISEHIKSVFISGELDPKSLFGNSEQFVVKVNVRSPEK